MTNVPIHELEAAKSTMDTEANSLQFDKDNVINIKNSIGENWRTFENNASMDFTDAIDAWAAEFQRGINEIRDVTMALDDIIKEYYRTIEDTKTKIPE